MRLDRDSLVYQTLMSAESPLRETVKDTLVYLPSQVIVALVGLAGIALYTRLLSPPAYGYYSLVVATVSLLLLPSVGWLQQATLRYFEEYKLAGRISVFASTVTLSWLIVALGLTIVWIMVTAITASALEQALTGLLWMAFLVPAAQSGFYWVMLSLLRADRQSARYSVSLSLEALGRLILSAALIYFWHHGPEAIFWSITLWAGGISLYELARLRQAWRASLSSFSFPLLKKLLAYGLPMMIVGVGETLLATADRYLLGYFRGAAEVGIYAAGYSIANVGVHLIYSALLLAAFPVIVQTYLKAGDQETGRLLHRVTAVYCLVLLPAVAGISALANELIALFLGSAFHEAVSIVPWIAGGSFFLGLIMYAYKPFQLKERMLAMFIPLSLAFLVNLGLNIALIPRWGISGAAWATIGGYLSYFAVAWWMGQRLLSFRWPWETFLKSAFGAGFMYVFLVFVLPPVPGLGGILLKVLVGVASYSIVIYILRERFIREGIALIWTKLAPRRRG